MHGDELWLSPRSVAVSFTSRRRRRETRESEHHHRLPRRKLRPDSGNKAWAKALKAMMYPWLTFFIGKSHKSPAIIPSHFHSRADTPPTAISITARDGLNFSVCNFSFLLYETSHNQKKLRKMERKEGSAEGEIMFHIGWRSRRTKKCIRDSIEPLSVIIFNLQTSPGWE